MNKNINFLIIFSVILLFSGYLFSDALAKQYPGLVVAINSDPYYWSENEFGWDILEHYSAPNVYQTDSSQSKEDALEEYRDNTKPTITSPATDDDRVMSVVVTFSGPDIIEKKIFYTFSSFNQPNTGSQFTLESLASKDKESFYEFVSRYVNAGSRPQLFDAQIDLVTGDGTVLNSWQFFKCEITFFETFRQENVLILSFLDKFTWEIRDHTEFDCQSKYLISDFSSTVKNPYIGRHLIGTQVIPTEKLGLIPNDEDRIMAYGVSIVGGEIPEGVSIQEFPLYRAMGTIVSEEFTTTVSSKVEPKFYLEGLVSKNKKPFYDYISRYFNPGKTPEPFDVNVDNITGDGTILIRNQYFDCQPTAFYTYSNDNLLTNKFHPGKDTEIRDHIEFECDGFYLSTDKISSPYVDLHRPLHSSYNVISSGNIIAESSDRVMDYVVHFEDGDFENNPLTLPTFSQHNMTSITSFDLSSLPSLEKERLYKILVGPSINPGKTPEPFDVVVDLVAGDSDIIIKYTYEDCKVTDYQQFLMNSLVTFKYTFKFEPEIRDTTSFSCNGFIMESNFEPASSPFSNIQNPILALQNTVDLLGISNATAGLENTTQGQIIPNNMTSVDSFIVHFSGREFPKVETIYSFGSFSPLTPTISNYENLQSTPPKFELQSLPSKDKAFLYEIMTKKPNPGKPPEPMDITIDSVTGDGTVLTSWQYFDCDIADYKPVDDDFLLFMKFTGKSASEISDITDFECEGLNLDVKDGKSYSPYSQSHVQVETTEQLSIIPNDDERVISLVVSISKGEFTKKANFFTSTKYAKHDGASFTFYNLISHDFELWDNFVADRYFAPGKPPELFDATVDLVTGDGITLQSWQYHKCAMDGLLFFTSDNWAFIRQSGKLVPEIRGKYTMDCAGYYVEIGDVSVKPAIIHKAIEEPGIYPVQQQEIHGESAREIECARELHAMWDPSTGLSYCVHQLHLNNLLARGWDTWSATHSEEAPKDQPSFAGRLIPTNQSRADSFNVNFIGREIPEAVRSTTFSSFVPLTINSLHPYSSNQMQQIASSDFGDVIFKPEMKPEFALKYLPTKDKKPFYDYISRYFNPGKTPEPFDVSVEFLTVYNSTISTWIYRDCQAESHHTSLDDSLLTIKYHGSWTKEFRDKTLFSCNGFRIFG